MAEPNGKLAEKEEKIPEKQTIEEVVEEAKVLEAEATIQDAEEAKKTEEEAKVPEVEVDLDEEREKTKKETIETVQKEIVEPLKKEIIDLKKVMEPEEKDDYDKFVEKYTAENGKAPEWKQVATFLEERAVNRIKAEQQAEKEKAETEKTNQEKTKQELVEQNVKIWNNQLDEMEKAGMIPKMEKNEKGDEGFDARIKLYGDMQSTFGEGKTPVTNMYEVYSKFYKQGRPQGAQPAGADAPISMGTNAEPEDEQDFKYDEIHQGARNLESFIANTLKKVGIGK